ncbi:MAG TPA: HD domain-containing protein [Candidatus Nanoarchaeia archaeon]|nr:HD domain-containing protein [Candidatus Nanoarchaeia archaeon]
MEENFINKIREKSRSYHKDLGGHGFDHVERVYNLAVKLAEKENADLEIVKLACLLHDIARVKEDNKECACHAEEGAKMAGQILKEADYPAEKIASIKEAIRVHRFSKGLKPLTKEAQILQDADRLEALGAICIARIFMYNGLHKLPIHIPGLEPEKEYHGQETTAINHFYEKILKIKPETFNTELAREIAKERYDFIVTFLEQFKDEWEGKR